MRHQAMTKRHRSSKGGFTLVEAVVGTGVFMIGSLGVFSLMSWILQANASSGRIVSAAAAAQTKLEELVELGYERVAGGTEDVGQYALIWTTTPSNLVKYVHLTVKWSDHAGREGTFTASSMVCDTRSTAILPDYARTGKGGSGGIPASVTD